MEYTLPKVAGIYITRKCNLSCGYCSVGKNNTLVELNEEKWIHAIDILKNIGIEKLVILGGEPTIKQGIENIVQYLSNNTSINFSIVSNGTADISIMKKLINLGLKKVSASIDTIKNKSLDKYTSLKSQKALNLFEDLQRYSINDLTAYFVLSAATLNQVVETVEYLSKKNIWLYILPYHYGKPGEDYWVTRDKEIKENLAFYFSHIPNLKKVVELLINMKKSGYLISNTEPYLLDLPLKIVDFKWHCTEYVTELRIDADGSLMCCHDNRGILSPKYTIFDIINEDKFREFNNARAKDAKNCPGCLWPSQYHSSEYLNAERLEV